MDGKKKNYKYGELMGKLKNSIENEFYYESIFIEYAILEDRTDSLLKHSKISKYDEYGKEMNLNSKLKTIEHSSKFNNDDYVKEHITYTLLSKLHDWKNRRNVLIHNLVETKYNNEDIKKIALEGYELIRKLNSKSTLINKYFDKIYSY